MLTKDMKKNLMAYLSGISEKVKSYCNNFVKIFTG